MRRPAPRRAALAVACFSLIAAVAFGVHADHPKPLPVPARDAVRVAGRDATMRAPAATATSTSVERIDGNLERVTFLRHGRVLAFADVQRDRHVFSPVASLHHQGYGTELTHEPFGFAIVTVLFLAAVLRRPLRRAATIDALALAGFTVPTVLVDRGYVVAGQGTAALLLA